MAANNQKGTYKTKIKSEISEIFTSSPHGTRSAADVHTELQSKGHNVNITTVYRNLELLTNEGYLIKFQDNKGDKAVYQYSGEKRKCLEHLHLKCTECGRVMHLDCSFMSELRWHIMIDHGFKLSCENSVIFGTCRECRETKDI